ncbi:hypothetical protein IGI04_042130 [Brassica rapa subsp. trilocularis]|uniref:Uncharacterized protein n=1 Tax=Brassica rapa subsp. trilocularis TaxID=1813537 RepID=A0ABQ7KW28_BRACM|nr:hypothetical protein IGI04_042130 [Brassica rapa subsp. trilocularis]
MTCSSVSSGGCSGFSISVLAAFDVCYASLVHLWRFLPLRYVGGAHRLSHVGVSSTLLLELSPVLGFSVRRRLSISCGSWEGWFGRTTSECGSHCTWFLHWFALLLKSNHIIVTLRDLGGTAQWAQLELSG